MGGKSLRFAVIFSSLLALSACGGSDDESPAGSINPDGTVNTGDSGGETPAPQEPAEPGLDADENPDNEAYVDEPVRPAIVPAYAAMGMAQLAIDVAQGLEPYPEHVSGTDDASFVAPGDFVCDNSTNMSVYGWQGADGDATLDAGESVEFNFENCALIDADDPTGATFRRLYSSDPARQVLARTADGDSYALDAVTVDGYDSLTVRDATLLVRDGAVGQAAGGDALTAQGAGDVLTLGGGADQPFEIQVTENADGTKTVAIRDAYISVDEDGTTSNYLISTPDPLTVRETENGLQVVDANPADTGVDGGRFRVEDLATGTIYNYTLAANTDCLWVSFDSDGDGIVDREGQIDQNLILDRLVLQ